MSARARIIWILIISLALLVSAPLVFAKSVEDEFGENEVKIGREAAQEIAKENKFSENAADLKRVREIGEKIAAIANKTQIKALYGSAKITPFDYEFHIIEDEDVNAYSVPGGFIYVNSGLLEFCETDQELAGVIAHEICHGSHHHMVYLLKKQAGLQNTMAIAILASMLGGVGGSDLQNVLLGVNLYQIAKLNGYGMQAERDADQGAILYMKEAGYNPVGLLTFLERLARQPELIEYGIYRSHPLDAERIRAAKDLIRKLGLPINRRETTDAVIAEVRIDEVNGVQIPGVYIQDKLIYRPAAGPDAASESETGGGSVSPFAIDSGHRGGQTAEEHARKVAADINELLDSGLQMHEISVDEAGAGVIAKGKALIVVSSEDAKLMGLPASQIAKDAAAAIRKIVWTQMVNTIH